MTFRSIFFTFTDKAGIMACAYCATRSRIIINFDNISYFEKIDQLRGTDRKYLFNTRLFI